MNYSLQLSGIDAAVLGVYHAVAEAAATLGIPWVIIGATARDLIYENAFGIEPRRRTSDVDLAIEVEDWDDYARLRTLLIANRAFQECGRERQRLRCGTTGLALDIVPFGGVERNQSITWPPDHDFRMTTHGLYDAMHTAIRVTLEAEPDLEVQVVHPAVLVAMKIFAWADKPERRKDAGDAAFMISAYENIFDNRNRLFTEHADLLDQQDFDLEVAYAQMLGRDLATLLRMPSRDELREVLGRQVHLADESRLAADMALQAGISADKSRKLIEGVHRGIQ